MPLSSIAVRDFMRDACGNPKMPDGYWLRRALIASLSPQQKRIFSVLSEKPAHWFTSGEICKIVKNKSRYSVDNELKRLYDLDLLAKVEQRDEHGLCYKYAVIRMEGT